jgi:hypothetical protein
MTGNWRPTGPRRFDIARNAAIARSCQLKATAAEIESGERLVGREA